MKKKLLITGAHGYIGKYFVAALQREYDVTSIDHELGSDLFDLRTLDGADVIHLAALTSVQESFQHPEAYYARNVLGTAHMLHLCRKEMQKLYYFSSAAAMHPESSPYARSKAMAHELVELFMPSVKSLIFMPFNIYSDEPKEGTMMDHFLNDQEITIHGDGMQIRDFIHIDDVVRILKAAIEEDWENKVMQLGMGTGYTVKYIAELFATYLDKRIVHIAEVKEIKESVADIRTLKALFSKPFLTDVERDIKRMTIYN